MFELTITHYVYFIFSILIFLSLIKKREIILVSIAGIIAVALAYSGSPVKAVQALCSAIIVGFSDLMSIFIAIALILSMTMAMKATGIDVMLARPLRRINGGPGTTFLIIGFLMFFVSLLIWPSPAVALMGAFFLPLARHSGLPAIYLAVAMNIFGHGAALSGDFLIQGVTAVTSAGAGLTSGQLQPYLIPLWFTMGLITIMVSFIMMKRNVSSKESVASGTLNDGYVGGCVSEPFRQRELEGGEKAVKVSDARGKGFIIAVAAFFIADIICMFAFDITGDDALFLIAGTVLILSAVLCLIFFGISGAASNLLEFVTGGFGSAMEIFAPAIVIIAFFSIGNTDTAQVILDENAGGLLSDIVFSIVNGLQIDELLLPVVQAVAGILYSMDGSGFAGITVIGEIAASYNVSAESVKILTALGQVTIIWVGGGTVIPWAVIPVSAICGVSPRELAKKNLIPVACGLAGTVICAMVMVFALG